MEAPTGLGIDFGTHTTKAVLRWPDGRIEPLLFEGSPMLPSAVYAEQSGGLSVGWDAINGPRQVYRFEPCPKQRCRQRSEAGVFLGGRSLLVGDLVARLLERVAQQAQLVGGELPETITLTCQPSPRFGRVLVAAALRIGLDRVRLVQEPAAVATYFTRVLRQEIPLGAMLAVYDFGGTFKLNLVERTAGGFRSVGPTCEQGGANQALMLHLRDTHKVASFDWYSPGRLAVSRQESRQLVGWFNEGNAAQELLASRAAANVRLPSLNRCLEVTREELQHVAQPLVVETIELFTQVLDRYEVARDRLAGALLIGGLSRDPLLPGLIERELGVATSVVPQPDLVVAEGAVLADEQAHWDPPMEPPTGFCASVPEIAEWVGLAIGSGVLGNAVYDGAKTLLRRAVRRSVHVSQEDALLLARLAVSARCFEDNMIIVSSNKLRKISCEKTRDQWIVALRDQIGRDFYARIPARRAPDREISVDVGIPLMMNVQSQEQRRKRKKRRR